jgi:tetratricopeptide (TPR) repeat protein
MALALGSYGLSVTAQNDPGMAAFALEKQGRNAEAEAAWRALAKENPSNPEPLAHIGFLEARQQHYAVAVTYYRKALALNPEMPGLQLNMGLALFKGGEYKEAIRVFEPLLKGQPASSPETQRLTLLLGMSYYGLGEYAAAAPYLKAASDQDPQNLTLLLTLAHSCLLSKQFPCVLDAYHRIVAQNAESAEADMLVGEALDEMKDPVGAQRELRAAIAANPKEPNVHFGLGYLLWTKEQYPEAAEQFRAELDNNPRQLQAMLYLADSYIQLSRIDEARPLLERLAQENPGSAMAHRDLGIVDAEAGQNDDALREFQKAIALKPADPNTHWRLARLYRTMGRKAEANAEFEKTHSLNKAEDDRLLKVMSTIPAGQSSTSTDEKK